MSHTQSPAFRRQEDRPASAASHASGGFSGAKTNNWILKGNQTLLCEVCPKNVCGPHPDSAEDLTFQDGLREQSEGMALSRNNCAAATGVHIYRYVTSVALRTYTSGLEPTHGTVHPGRHQQQRLCREPPPSLYFTVRNISSSESCVKRHRYQKGPTVLKNTGWLLFSKKSTRKRSGCLFWGEGRCLLLVCIFRIQANI